MIGNLINYSKFDLGKIILSFEISSVYKQERQCADYSVDLIPSLSIYFIAKPMDIRKASDF